MAGGHVHALYRHHPGGLHRVEPQVKVATTLLFVLAVVAAPREAFWAFGVFGMLLAALTAWGRIPPGFVLRRMLIEIPFLLFAVFLPFIGSGDRVDVAGLSLSVGGLWAAWNILAKATLGAWASILLAATTQVPGLLEGLSRLRAPKVITAIMGFMVRYLDVIVGEWNRMRVALRSRAYRPRTLRQIGPLAAASGSLFIRSYERGERVYLAMLSRGYTGAMPETAPAAPALRQWLAAAVVVTGAAAVTAMGWVTR
ncbi:MAG: cobalt ECF transporter T component CbiQ [Actinobacteria bacterium]|nr:cobalt ECF transporter T component CbiQ [Actinomycetota bacterium]MBU1494798.1 cobalt ECF transporter T component CbiQ [Actinomycetota bacterium]MBU1864903.1 cobalt ECF transporter T component CbiQ [Actinomycetota bacterium]